MQFEPDDTNEQTGSNDKPKLPMNTTPPPIPTTAATSTVIPPLPKARPTPSLRLVGILAASLLGLLMVGMVGSSLLRSASRKALFHANRDKVEVLKQLGSLQHPSDVKLAHPFCTTKGFHVWNRGGGFLPSAKDGFEIVGFQNSGDLCDVAMVSNTVQGVTKLHVRLVRLGNQWRYDDVYFSEEGGRKIGLWASFIQEHPIIASAKVLQPEIKAVYGEAKAALRGTADTIHDVATIVSVLKGLK